MTHHLRWRHDLPADDVVGDVEQALDEELVAGDAFCLDGIAVAAHRRALDVETALGANRHDDGVLDHLRLDQAQHFGTEILAAIRPAQAATRHRAEAQVHAFHARAVNEDFAIRTRLGQIRHPRRIQFEADAVWVLAVLVGLVIVGAQGRIDHIDEAAQDAVFVQAGHAIHQLQQGGAGSVLLRVAIAAACFQHGFQRLERGLVAACQCKQFFAQALLAGEDLCLGFSAGGRIEACFEQFHQQARQQRITGEGGFDVGLRERHRRLQQVFAVAAQQGHLAPMQAGRQDQAIEAVVFGVAVPDALERFAEAGIGVCGIDLAGGRFDLEILDVNRRFADLQPIRPLGNHAQAHVFHHRHRIGQRNIVELAVQLQAQAFARVQTHAIVATDFLQAQMQIVRAVQRGEMLDVGHRRFDRRIFDIAGRQCAAEVGRHTQAIGLAMPRNQRFAQGIAPVAQQVRQPRFEFGGVELQRLAALGTHDQVQLRQRRFAQHHAGVDVFAVQRVLQQGFDAQAHIGVEAFARDVHQRRDETPVLVAAQEQAATHALLQPEDAHRGAVQLFFVGLEQLLARQRFQDVAQGLAAMAARSQPRLAHHIFVALTHQRNFPWAAVVGAGREQAQEALLADDAALGVEFQDADVIHVTDPMHARACIGLGQDQRILELGRGVQPMRGQRGHRARRRGVASAQQAQAGLFQRRQHVLAILLLHPILAVAEEGEVVGRGPAQELLGLMPADVVDRQTAGRQIVGQHDHALAHRRPVLHDGAHLGQHLAHCRFQLGHFFRRLAVDLQHHQRFALALAHCGELAGLVARDAQHRMAQHVHADAQVGQGHADRIHQERHIVVDDLQQGMRRLVAVALQGRVEHPHVDRAGLARARELQHVRCQRRPLLWRMVREFVLLHAPVEVGGERLDFGLTGGRVALAQCGKHRLEGHRLRFGGKHGDGTFGDRFDRRRGRFRSGFLGCHE